LSQAPSVLQNIPTPQGGGNSPDLINALFSPEGVRPFPKAGPQKVSNREEKRRKAAVLIDAHGKRVTEEEERLREEKQNKKATVRERTDTESKKLQDTRNENEAWAQ
jgi:hypothetical protein